MAWEDILAKEFKKRDNKDSGGPIIGTVVSKSPARISIAEGKIMLTKSSLILANGSDIFNYECSDRLMLIPNSSGQVFFIVNKLGSLD